MTRNVLVTLRGTQSGRDGEDAGLIETEARGEYYQRNGKHYVLYDEAVGGSDGSVRSRLKFDERIVEVSRNGAVACRMVFEENKKNLTGYGTPFGQILMGIATKKIELTQQEDRITVEVDYALDANDAFVSDCHMVIEIRSVI